MGRNERVLTTELREETDTKTEWGRVSDLEMLLSKVTEGSVEGQWRGAWGQNV